MVLKIKGIHGWWALAWVRFDAEIFLFSCPGVGWLWLVLNKHNITTVVGGIL